MSATINNQAKAATVATFRAKARESRYSDGTLAGRWIQVPYLRRSHVDMGMARASKRWGMYANSDLFESMLNRAVENMGARKVGDALKLDLTKPLPDGISIDESGFLAEVRITFPD